MKPLLISIKEKLTKKKVTKNPPRNACYFCKRKTSELRKYKNEINQKVKVCHLCVEYAERRAYLKC